MVTTTTSFRRSPSPPMIGTASRHIATTSTTSPPSVSGRYSRSRLEPSGCAGRCLEAAPRPAPPVPFQSRWHARSQRCATWLPVDRSIARRDDASVRKPELDPQDLAFALDRAEQAFEVRELCRGERRAPDDRRIQPLMDEAADGRHVALHDRVECGRRRVDGDHDGLCRGRDADDCQQHAKDDREQNLPRRSRPRSKHAACDTPMRVCAVWIGKVSSPT